MGRFGTLAWFCILLASGLGVYAGGLHVPHYGDDFGYIYDPPPDSVIYYFSHVTHSNQLAYRPIEATALVMIQKQFGIQTWPLHLLSIFLHVILCWLVYLAAVILGFSRVQAVIASTYMLVAQLSPHAVLSNDTLSQVCGTLFGFASVCLFQRSYAAPGSALRTRYAAYTSSLVTFAIALFAKETSLSVPLVITFLVLVTHLSRSGTLTPPVRSTIVILPYVILVGLYFAARYYAGAQSPEAGEGGTYSVRVGQNVFINSGLLAVASLLPVSSVTVVSAVRGHNLPIVVLVAVAFTGFLLLLMWDQDGRRRTALGLAICAYLSLFPAVLASHVSELYAYNALPYVSLIVGLALGRLLTRNPLGSLQQGIVSALLLVLLISLGAAVVGKARMMSANGERATRLIQEVARYVDDVGPGGDLVLVSPDSGEAPYAIYVLPHFKVLDNYSRHRLRQISGRADFNVQTIKESELARTRFPQGSVILRLNGDRVVASRGPDK